MGLEKETRDVFDKIHRDHAGDEGSYEMWSTNGGAATLLETGQFFQRALGSVGGGESTVEAGPTYRYSRFFIRFRDIFGTGANQISPDASVNSATLKLYNTEDLGAEVAAAGAFFSTFCHLFSHREMFTKGGERILSQTFLFIHMFPPFSLLIRLSH